jgi:hypothetical protein
MAISIPQLPAVSSGLQSSGAARSRLFYSALCPRLRRYPRHCRSLKETRMPPPLIDEHAPCL